MKKPLSLDGGFFAGCKKLKNYKRTCLAGKFQYRCYHEQSFFRMDNLQKNLLMAYEEL